MAQKNNKLIDTVIIGAGISGLSAAWQLKKKGYKILVLEKENLIGGKIQTHQDERCISELGPDTFLQKSPHLMRVIESLNLTEKMLRSADSARKRYIYINKKLVHLPIGMKQFLISPFLPWHGKLRLALEPFISAKKKNQEQTVAQFFGKRMGQSAVRNLFDPFVSGIYAGDVNKLSADNNFGGMVKASQRYGSIFSFMKKAMKRLAQRKKQGYKPKSGMYSFAQGLNVLNDGFVSILEKEIINNATVQKIIQSQKGTWNIEYTDASGQNEQITSKTVLLATPAYVTANLLQPFDLKTAQLLQQINYPALATGTLYFDKSDIPHSLDGFGYLIPRSQKIELLGAIWHGSLFPQHVNGPYHAFRFYIGGDTNSEIINKNEDRIINQVTTDIQKTMNLSSATKPIFYQFHLDPHAIPQYYVGHQKLIHDIENNLRNYSGLFVTGNYLNGVSLNDCVEQSNRSCWQVIQYLSAKEA